MTPLSKRAAKDPLSSAGEMAPVTHTGLLSRAPATQASPIAAVAAAHALDGSTGLVVADVQRAPASPPTMLQSTQFPAASREQRGVRPRLHQPNWRNSEAQEVHTDEGRPPSDDINDIRNSTSSAASAAYDADASSDDGAEGGSNASDGADPGTGARAAGSEATGDGGGAGSPRSDAANDASSNRPRAAVGSSLKHQAEELRSALALESSLPLPALLRKACEALCVSPNGPLLQLASRLRQNDLPALERRVRRIQQEMGLSAELSLAGVVAAANQQLGISQLAPMCRQVERLYQVIGLHR